MNKQLRIFLAVLAVAIVGSGFVWGKDTALKILAYWVVFGLPVLLAWRVYLLSKMKGFSRNYYIGTLIVYAGIAMWIPFALLRRILGVDISVFPFLTLHLMGVSTGAIIKRRAMKKQKAPE